MTNVIIEETAELKGFIRVPPSKSYTHRCIIAASLSKGKSRIFSPLFSDDTLATIKACSSLGISIEQMEDRLEILGSSELIAPKDEVDCGESASTIRFLAPIAALAKGETVLTGSPGLRRRPVGPLVSALEQLGVRCKSNRGFPPIIVFGGGIRGGNTSLVGDVSSQFVTGLLFACPLAENNTQILLTTSLESKPYVELTLDIIKKHGIHVDVSGDFRKFEVPGRQEYRPHDHTIPGDFSSAAFLLAAAAITGSHIRVENLSLNQPDSEIVEILGRMRINVKVRDGSIEVFRGELKGVIIDAKDTPDLVPVCAVLACFSKGTTKIYGAKRLRIKETDRLAALLSELRKMGAKIVENLDGLTIEGLCDLKGTTVNSHNDHRIAMACAIAALKARGKTEILRAECVSKSYPNFFNDLTKLGGNIHVS